MASGYSISIASDTKAFQTGVQKGMIEPLEDAADILEEIGRDGGRDIEQVERAAKESQEATEELKRDFSDLQKTIRDTGRKAKTDFANPMNKATADAGRGLKEFKNEAKQNFAEVASSSDGTAQGIADGIQGTLGGAAVAVGGAAGVALGALAVAGGAALTQLTADTERMKEQTSTAFQAMAAEGIEAWRSVESETQRLTDAYDNHEGEIKKIAEITGLSFETVASAWAGNKDAAKLVTSAYSEMKTELRNTFGVSVEAANATIAGWDGVLKPLNDTTQAYDAAERKAERLWNQIVTGTDEATHQQRIYRDELDELSRRPPITIPVEPQFPTPDQMAERLAGLTRGRRLRVPVDLVTRSGKVLPD